VGVGPEDRKGEAGRRVLIPEREIERLISENTIPRLPDQRRA